MLDAWGYFEDSGYDVAASLCKGDITKDAITNKQDTKPPQEEQTNV